MEMGIRHREWGKVEGGRRSGEGGMGLSECWACGTAHSVRARKNKILIHLNKQENSSRVCPTRCYPEGNCETLALVGIEIDVDIRIDGWTGRLPER